MFVSKGVIGRVIDVKNSNGVVMWTVMSTRTLFSHGKAAIHSQTTCSHPRSDNEGSSCKRKTNRTIYRQEVWKYLQTEIIFASDKQIQR